MDAEQFEKVAQSLIPSIKAALKDLGSEVNAEITATLPDGLVVYVGFRIKQAEPEEC